MQNLLSRLTPGPSRDLALYAVKVVPKIVNCCTGSFGLRGADESSSWLIFQKVEMRPFRVVTMRKPAPKKGRSGAKECCRNWTNNPLCRRFSLFSIVLFRPQGRSNSNGRRDWERSKRSLSLQVVVESVCGEEESTFRGWERSGLYGVPSAGKCPRIEHASKTD